MDLGDLSGLIGRSTVTCLLPSSSARRPGPENALGGSEGAEAPRAWSARRWGDADHGSEAAEGGGSRWVRWGGWSLKCPKATAGCWASAVAHCSNTLQQYSFVVKRMFQNPSGCFGRRYLRQ